MQSVSGLNKIIKFNWLQSLWCRVVVCVRRTQRTNTFQTVSSTEYSIAVGLTSHVLAVAPLRDGHGDGRGRRRGEALGALLVRRVLLQAGEQRLGRARAHAPPAAARAAHRVPALLVAGALAQDDAERGRVLPVAARVPVLRLLVEAAPDRLRACTQQKLWSFTIIATYCTVSSWHYSRWSPFHTFQ